MTERTWKFESFGGIDTKYGADVVVLHLKNAGVSYIVEIPLEDFNSTSREGIEKYCLLRTRQIEDKVQQSYDDNPVAPNESILVRL